MRFWKQERDVSVFQIFFHMKWKISILFLFTLSVRVYVVFLLYNVVCWKMGYISCRARGSYALFICMYQSILGVCRRGLWRLSSEVMSTYMKYSSPRTPCFYLNRN